MNELAPYKARYEFDATKPMEVALDFVGGNPGYERFAQPTFMKMAGLQPHHKFLDLGCGTLRGTVDLIDYVDPGNFYGMDVSSGLLCKGAEYAAANGCKNRPRLSAINDFDLWKYVDKKVRFDYILSVSLLTHIEPADVYGLFYGVKRILRGVWYFTIYPTANGHTTRGDMECRFYGKKFLIEVGREIGLEIEDIPGDYQNPCRNFIDRVNTPYLGQWVMKAVVT